MFILSIFLAGRDNGLFFNFKYRPAAEAALAALGDAALSVSVTDDFGHHGVFRPAEIAAVLVTDLEMEHALHGDMQVLQARAQVKAQQKMAADPALKFAAGMMNGGQMGGVKPPFMS